MVELDILPANPITKVTWKAPEVAEDIDRRVVASPAQVRQLLAAVSRIRPDLTAFFGCLYYATMRPGEAVLLRRADLREAAGLRLGQAATHRQCATSRLGVDRFRQRSR